MRFRGHSSLFAGSALKAFLVLAILLSASAPASAQGFLDMFFGGGSSYKASAPKPKYLTPGGRSYQASSVFAAPVQRWSSYDSYGSSTGGGGKYRTLCVRLCDGYYYPISASASRSGFMSDQMRCNATCGAEARLFYVSAKNPDMNEAVDMSGRPYTGLANAFRYRKSLVQGCQCRPEPWSEAEMNRHRRYAEAEAARARPHREAAVALVDADTVQAKASARAPQADDAAGAGGAKPTIVAEAPQRADEAAAASEARQAEAEMQPTEPAEDVIVPTPRRKAKIAGRAGRKTTVRIVAASRVRVVEVPRASRISAAKPRQAKAIRVAARPANVPPMSGGMSLGAGSTMVWPGDAPAGRRRNG